MERNIPLLRKVYRQIKDNPKTHNQRLWVQKATETCGTTGCAAGWAVLLGDPEAEMEWHIRRDGSEVAAYVQPVLHAVGRNHPNIGSYAALLLGLTADERYWLFDEARTRAEVLGGLADLIRGKSVEYMDLGTYDPEDYDWSDAETDDIDRPSTQLAAEIAALEEPEDPYGPSLDADWGVPDLEFQELHA